MSGNYMLFPWSTEFWQLFLNNPMHGEVDQEILPSWFSTNIIVTGLGEPELEQRIVTEVATYGKQLGELTDVVLALAQTIKLTDSEALQELQTIAEQVESTKRAHRKSVQQRAELALKELAEADPEGLLRLMEAYQPPQAIHKS
ncbi:hypothetical protein ACUNV4_26375 [Granulosicoccus sp. 3-233]|uniref:hypothetical protein n=1 Tax=Granulosicoccus sp. 3-233 TaxID=3417969 RepID=UPI003D32C76A